VNTARPQNPSKSGLFSAVYRIGSDEPVSPVSALDLVVSTVSKQVPGTARITQTTNRVTDLLYSPGHGKFEAQEVQPGVILSGGFHITAARHPSSQPERLPMPLRSQTTIGHRETRASA